MTVVRRWGVALAALAMAASVSAAQGKPPVAECPLSFDKPDELKDAYNALNKAIVYNGRPDQQKKSLGQAVEKLTLRADHYATNQAAHELLLGEALVMWSKIPGEPDMPPRGTIGYLGDKEQPIDLLKTADSLFTDVEKAQPKCTDQIAGYRQMAWGPIIVKVGPLINQGNVDSASATLDRANSIYRDSPYNYYFAGQIEYKRGHDQKSSEAYEQAAKLGAKETAANPTDANLANITEYSSFFAGYTGARAAAVLSGPEQVAAYKRVIPLYQAYLKNYNCPQFAENAQSGVFDAMRTIGDTAGVRAELTHMADKATPCTDMSMYNAARDAKDIDATALAVTLADKAVAFSPWSAGLGNAAAVYLDAKAWDKLLPVGMRLTQIAPNSPDNYQLVALAYLGFKDKATGAKRTALSDSANTFYETGEKLDVNVRIDEFTSDGPKRTVGGTVKLVDHTVGAKPAAKGAKKGAKPAPAPAGAPKPRQVMVKMDFLDRGGAVVKSDSVSVTASAAEPTKFQLVVEDDKIVGYKYAKIP
jgi:tetratricopeptide (TPR) repeat protein